MTQSHPRGGRGPERPEESSSQAGVPKRPGSRRKEEDSRGDAPARSVRDARDKPNRPKRRGRPPGSISLTNGIENTILTFIRAGVFDHVAAEAAGISVRTFHDWIARGEGRHPTRPRSARLRKFSENVSRARAEARLDAEVRVHRTNPVYWLSRAARTKPGKEGWSEPHTAHPGTDGLGPPFDGTGSTDTIEELTRVIRELLMAGEITVPQCSNRKCPCPWHRTKEEA
jgi:hypothetical protein